MTYFYPKALEVLSPIRRAVKSRSPISNIPVPTRTIGKRRGDAGVSIEAASRSHSGAHADEAARLVRKIIYNKLNEGELENTDLSMADLNRITESFSIILNGVYHTGRLSCMTRGSRSWKRSLAGMEMRKARVEVFTEGIDLPFRDIDEAWVANLSGAVCGALALEDVAISVILTDDDCIRSVNNQYRMKDRPTAVISFAYREDPFPEAETEVEERGDIYISLERAAEQAVVIRGDTEGGR
jgi:hypothetical protein